MKYKLLGKSGLRVSELCLGTMTFGTEWGYGADKENSKKVFQAFLNAGGNFIDTANRYTEGTSENFLGEFMHGERERIVLATKYSLYTKMGDPNASGNHRKNMVQAVEASLKRLKTDYIDLYYLHAWDFTTSVEEVMRGLDDLVRAGKVVYIGISDTPAWIISRANMMAELRGWSSFVSLQVEYSLIQRTPERELLPMAKELDIAVTAWGSLAGGALTGKYLEGKGNRLKPESARLNERSVNIAKLVVDIAKESNVSPSTVALSWVKQQGNLIIPVVGARQEEQVNENVKNLDFRLTEDQLARLNSLTKIEPGFPHDFLSSEGVKTNLYAGVYDQIINHKKK